MTNEQIEQYARIAYEAGPESIFPRTPWDELSPGWKAYWHTLAKAVRKAAMEEACSIVYGQCESDNVAQRTVDAIRAAAGEE